MPHYCNGDEVKVGDVVAGRGYNIKHDICGVVVGVVPGADSCNMRVAYLKVPEQFELSGTEVVGCAKGVSGNRPTIINNTPVVIELEYGDTKGFDRIDIRLCPELPPLEEIF